VAPRIRSIKPDCWQDAALGRVSRDARLLFVGLITQADDGGRMPGDPRLLKAQVFPYDDNLAPSEIDAWLDELEQQGLVRCYAASEDRFVALPGWETNQKISHPTPSKLPPPPERSGTFARPRESVPLIGREGIGVEGKDRVLIGELFEFWKTSFGRNGRTKLSPERVRKLKARLRDSTPEEIRAAITGVASSKWHRENGHDDLDLICRDRAHIEKYAALHRKEVKPRDPNRNYTRPLNA
jgi:hypothetical protein